MLLRIILAGLPTVMQLSGMSFITTLPAPITTWFPIETPGITIVLTPITQLAPIVVVYFSLYHFHHDNNHALKP